ncbi:hypothetical protein CBR_g8370 [Chara braunii]|uniref:Uncharacterized protein n=1 Tax=Chara braunii TaxID=69332 RepID=A0A388KLZ9_CHABU|nr:hypothetical protein CBR_g8370 [Chara braunii]|eukprot:GBG71071.1 hypothetical protein CBR_g8370 [Chara braunii]
MDVFFSVDFIVNSLSGLNTNNNAAAVTLIDDDSDDITKHIINNNHNNYSFNYGKTTNDVIFIIIININSDFIINWFTTNNDAAFTALIYVKGGDISEPDNNINNYNEVISNAASIDNDSWRVCAVRCPFPAFRLFIR